MRTSLGSGNILIALALIVGLTLVVLMRPARMKPVPARIVPGDAVSADDGTSGIVLEVQNGAALVQIDAQHAVWTDAALLMDAEGAVAPEVADAAATRLADLRKDRDSLPALDAFPTPRSIASEGGWLQRVGAGVYDARGIIASGWLIAVIMCLPLAGTAEKSFTAGGYTPDGETMSVVHHMRDRFGLPIAKVDVIVPGSATAAQAKLDESAAAMYRVGHVVGVTKAVPSSDGKLTTFTVYFDALDEDVVDSYDPLKLALVHAGFTAGKIQLAGTPSFYYDIGDQTKKDLAKAEQIGIPLALLILLFVFGTAVSAVLPLLVGMTSVVITLALLHLLSIPLHLSVYVMNIASMLGLGLGIDYSLLGVSRFRDELAKGACVRDAVIITVTSAGRAAAISGCAVLVGMAALALIPLNVMISMAIAGVIVVAVSVLATLTMLPALLGMLGHKVERLPVRRVRPTREDSGFWYRGAHLVMRHPGMSIALALFMLLGLSMPLRSMTLGVPHDDVLPKNSPALVASRTLQDRFDVRVTSPIYVELATADAAKVDAVVSQLKTRNNVESVKVVKVSTENGASLIAVTSKVGALGGPAQRAMSRDFRTHLKTDAKFLLSGQGPGEIEFLDAIKQGVPKTLFVVFASTFVILLFAFRSVALPIKAIVLAVLSIGGSLGAVVAVFQHGTGAGLLGAHAMGYTESTIPIIQFCVLFGLSMDYEVFMLARVSELYQAGYGNRESTARGVASTAPLVTGAALILIALGMSFATTEIVLVKQIGFGMAIALLLDATLVRCLLLPATMRLLGDINWWMPRFLRRRIPRVDWAH